MASAIESHGRKETCSEMRDRESKQVEGAKEMIII
jgi:hypothetical protein